VPRMVLVVASEEFCFCSACCDRREGNGQGHKDARDAFGGHFFSPKFSTPRRKGRNSEGWRQPLGDRSSLP
jgi:hypothetical protein